MDVTRLRLAPAVFCLLVVVVVTTCAWRVAEAVQDPIGDYWERTPLPEMGLATFYSRGTMDWVWSYRLQAGHVSECSDCVGAVALLRAGDLGRKVWLQPPGGDLVGPFLVVDCAHTGDISMLLDRNWVVDVSYEVGQLWGMDRPLDGVVVWADPAEGQAAAQPERLLSYIDPKDVVLSAPTPTPQGLPAVLPGFPTRLPVPLARPPTPTRRPTPAAARPIMGTPVITAPTPTVNPHQVATGLPALTSPLALPNDSAAPAAPARKDITAIGRPGAALLTLAVPVERSPVTPVLRDAPGASSAATASPILPGPQVSAPSPRDGGPESLPARLWQALKELFGLR